MNKCFILVEYHYDVGVEGSWMNDKSLWDIYENVKYANFGEMHTIRFKPTESNDERVIVCVLSDKKCTTAAEFNDLVRPYLKN